VINFINYITLLPGASSDVKDKKQVKVDEAGRFVKQ